MSGEGLISDTPHVSIVQTQNVKVNDKLKMKFYIVLFVTEES